MRTVTILDAAVIAVCTGLTVGAVVALNTGGTELVTKNVEVVVAPKSCVQALDAAADVVNDTTTLLEVANKLGPLTADAYAAGLAGKPALPIVDRVARLNQQLDDAYVAAAVTPKRFVVLNADCRAERVAADE